MAIGDVELLFGRYLGIGNLERWVRALARWDPRSSCRCEIAVKPNRMTTTPNVLEDPGACGDEELNHRRRQRGATV